MSIEIPRDVMLAALKAGQEEWSRIVILLRKAPKPCEFLDEDLRNVNFPSLTFPTHVRFDGSTFNDAKFSGTVFEQGASFAGCTFKGLTEINIHKGGSDLSFGQANFEGPLRVWSLGETRSISFTTAQFKEGLLARGYDKHHCIEWPTLTFRQVKLQGDLILENCSLSLSDFRHSHLSMALDDMKDNQCRASFRNSTFKAGAHFESVEFHNVANFENSDFLGSSSFERTIFHRAPNFHDAKLHQGTRFSPKSEFPLLFRDLNQPGAAEAYRTLKLAMNKQHALNEELGFFLLEMRATALRLPKWQQIPYRVYDLLSMYGQSVVRPLLWYLLLHLIFGLIYSLLSGQHWEAFDSNLTALTLYGAVPFAPALRWAEISGGGSVFPDDRLVLVQVAVVMQSIASALLLFLIALGLRNMFKVR